MTSPEPERGLEIYQARMKIEETFRDCKGLLHLPKIMNKRLDNLEKMIALALMAYAVALLFGEAPRDVTYGKVEPDKLQDAWFGTGPNPASEHQQWRLYSGMFVLIKQKPRLPKKMIQMIAKVTVEAFAQLVFGNVRSFVLT